MVNNAGVVGHHAPSLPRRRPSRIFTRSWRSMSRRVMAGTRDAARHMSEHGGGSIINLTSIRRNQAGGGGDDIPRVEGGGHPVHQVRRNRAGALRDSRQRHRSRQHPHGDCPEVGGGGGRRTARTVRGEDSRADAGRPTAEARGQPSSDVAEAALYFAGDRSRYVTGTVLPVDGGTVAGKVITRNNTWFTISRIDLRPLDGR